MAQSNALSTPAHAQPQPFIRPYAQSDWDDGLHIFFSTLDPTLHADPARTISSYLYYKAYALLSPSTCFVLDAGDGRAVGYCIGTPDTPRFRSAWLSSLVPVVDPKLVPPLSTPAADLAPAFCTPQVVGLRTALYEGECSMLVGPGLEGVLQRYPAHLHVNVLEGWRGRGWGARLVGAFLEAVKGMGVRGCHLGMVRGNEGAKRFYVREGWGVLDVVVDGGESGEVGVQGDALCMVRGI